MLTTKRLKGWKGAYLEGRDVCGNADYLIAVRRAYLEAPFACVIEALSRMAKAGSFIA